ncbi:hypothetical protein BPAE_0010g00890 [Botrytis paeoniae]|uniref:Uncharacterized protein n=1 Tax=Botrytis paeoniae TaxID=278948 RepID=A0A4Z1G6N5_9HELO|nr:hypothetical protein BPAE_0010g00890 [Botrytis paeoniae]
MTLPSAEQTFPTALSRNADPWLSIPGFLGASHVSSNDPDDLMQDVPELVIYDDPIESSIWFTPDFVHGLLATQLEPGQDSCQAITPVQPPLNHMSSLNKKAKSKSNACTPATDNHLPSATNRVKGSARIGKTRNYSGASASVIRKRARERKAHLFQVFAPLEKAKKALKFYSKSSRHFKKKSESLFLQLEKLIDEVICSDDASDSSSMLEASDLEADSAYGSFSDMPLSDVSSSVSEAQHVHLGRQATAPSSIQNSELHSDEETPRQVQPLSPIYSCIYGPGDERCPYATSRKSDWIRHEESEKHWPQKRYMSCGFCTYHFKDWEERKHHVAEHFKRGADISNWNPLLQNPRRKTADEPGSPPRNDDDDDDNLHQHGKGSYSTYEATQITYSTTSSDSSGSFDLSNNGYLNWDNNEGGWRQYNLEYEERCSNSLESCVTRLLKSRQGMKLYNPTYELFEPYGNEFISNLCFTRDEALSSEPIDTVSTAFHGSMVTYQASTYYTYGTDTKSWNYLLESTTGLETINGALALNTTGNVVLAVKNLPPEKIILVTTGSSPEDNTSENIWNLTINE